jgi:hypothetical protein
MQDPDSIAVSPDGHSAYTAAYSGGLAAFARNLPTCASLQYTITADQTATLPLACQDADGDRLVLGATRPSHGTLGPIDQAASTVTYTPAAGYTGSDSFTYFASDGTLWSLPATISLSIQPDLSSFLRALTPSGPTFNPRRPTASMRILRNTRHTRRRSLRIRVTCSERCAWQIRVRREETRSQAGLLIGDLNTRLTTPSKTITVPLSGPRSRTARRAHLIIDALVIFPSASFVILLERILTYRKM